MSGVSMVRAALLDSAAVAERRNASRSGQSTATTRPGLVQNCPAPITSEPTKSLPIFSPRAFKAAGSRNSGLTLLISA